MFTNLGFCTKCVLYTKVISHILKSPTSQRKTNLDSVSLSRHNSSEILWHCYLLMPHFSYWTRFPWVQCGLPGAPQRYLYYIKLFLSTPWKHKGGWIYSSTHSEPRPVNCTPRPVNLQREPHHALKKTGCAPKPVWAFEVEKIFCSYRALFTIWASMKVVIPLRAHLFQAR